MVLVSDDVEASVWFVAPVEVLNFALAALAPAVTLTVDQPVIGALLGTAAVIVGGIRSTYRWQENWISRSRSRYAIERDHLLQASGTALRHHA